LQKQQEYVKRNTQVSYRKDREAWKHEVEGCENEDYNKDIFPK
jgi:hypothetical protein